MPTPWSQRNVVTLSHLDRELHEWLKEEAHRRSQKGKRVHAYQLVEQAVKEFKARLNGGEEVSK